jgi:outer membrane immunogenic protein
MKKHLIALVAAIASSSTPALAADMALKAPPPAPSYNWTGFYVGPNVGYGWGNSATDGTFGDPATPFSSSQTMNGWLGGGQAGYNWQFNRNWVFGVEADIEATGQNSAADPSAATPCTAPTYPTYTSSCSTSTGSLNEKLPWFGTARLRLGFLPANRWMLYATGGLAFGEVESTSTVSTTTTTTTLLSPASSSLTTVAAAATNTTRAGWTIGGGSEWILSGPWTAKLEYLYVDLGSVSNTWVGLGPLSPINTSSHITDNILRVGVNYIFR